MAKVKESSPPTPPLTLPLLPFSSDGSQHEDPSGSSSNYTILNYLGEGNFGQVARCLKLDTSDIVVIKFPKYSRVAENEVSIMKQLRCLDPDKCHIVTFHDCVLMDGHTCLVLELLDTSLMDYMIQRNFTPLHFNDIRSIIQQMATALKALKSVGVIHTDIKLDNIMLVDHLKEPFRVKLIDFGLAILWSEAKPGSTQQPLLCRSPEILLGLPFSEAIDMWSLGCVMSDLFVCQPLFPGQCDYDVMRFIVNILGQPADHLLDDGLKTFELFYMSNKGWRLKTPEEFTWETDPLSIYSRCYTFRSLDHLTESNLNKEDGAEVDDRRKFVDLLKQMLQMDASERITPSEVLTHPFVTTSHLTNGSHHSSHSEAPPPAITMQRDSETVDERASQPSSSQKRTEVDDCDRGTSTRAELRINLVQPNPDMLSNQSDGTTEQDSFCPQAVLDKVFSSQESLSETPLSPVITEGTSSLDTTEVGVPTVSPAVDSATVVSTLVPLSSPAAGPAPTHSTSEVSKPKKNKKKRVQRFFSRLLRALCCCGAG